MQPRTDLFVRVHYGDLSFCSYALKFIERNWAEETSMVHVLANRDCQPVASTWGFSSRVKFHYVDPWPDFNQFAGYLVLTADSFSDAEYLAFLDADTMLLEPLRASDLIEDGKPIAWYRPYQESGPDYIMVPQRMWAPIMERWLGVKPDREYMIRFPFIFRAGTLGAFRHWIENKTGTTVEKALYSDVPYSPATFGSHPFKMCEFNCISFYAYLHEPDQYVFRHAETVQSWPVKQYWSWGWSEHVQAELERLLIGRYPERLGRRITKEGWMIMSEDIRDGHSSLVAQAGDMHVDVGGLRTQEFIGPYLKPGTVAIDVGAHIGTHTVCIMRALGPNGLVIAIEPHPAIVPCLLYNVAKERHDNPNAAHCTVLERAAGAEDGSLKLHCNPCNYASNTILDNVFDCSLQGVDVKVVPLDAITGDIEICFIKIDVEGAEWQVIRGGEKLIRRWHPVIFMEWSENFHAITGVKEEQFLDYLRELGYTRFVPFPEDWVRAGHHAHDLLVLP